MKVSRQTLLPIFSWFRNQSNEQPRISKPITSQSLKLKGENTGMP